MLLALGENGAPGAIPTRDLPLRRRTLYATELREHTGSKVADALFRCPETRHPRDHPDPFLSKTVALPV